MQRRYENIRLEHNGIMPRESNKKKKNGEKQNEGFNVSCVYCESSSPLWRMVNKN